MKTKHLVIDSPGSPFPSALTEEIVADQVLCRITLRSSASNQDDTSDQYGHADGGEGDTLELESRGNPSEDHNDEELDGTEGHVEEGRLVVVETETLDEKSSELNQERSDQNRARPYSSRRVQTHSSGDVGSGIEQDRGADHDPGLRVPEGFKQLRHLELARSRSSLVEPDAFVSNGPVVLGQPLGVVDIRGNDV